MTTDPSVRDLVGRALLPLKAVEEGLHEWAVGYVVDGAHPQALSGLTNHGPMVSDCLRVTGTIYYRFDDAHLKMLEAVGVPFNEEKDRSARTIFALRAPLYRDGALSAPQWVRLGRLLDRARRTDVDWVPRTPERVPDWFDALVMDVAGTIDPAISTRDYCRKWALDQRPGWDAAHLSALLQEEGTDAAGIPPILFLAAFADASEQSWGSPWPMDLPGMIDCLCEHASQIPVSLLDSLGRGGRFNVLQAMADDDAFARAGAHLVAALSTAASKKVRRKAIGILSTLDPRARRAAAAPALAGATAPCAVELVELLASADDDDADLLDEARRANPGLAGLIARTRARRATLASGRAEPLEVPPFAPLDIGPGAAPAGAELRAALDRLAGIAGTDPGSVLHEMIENARGTTDADLDALVAAADGESRECPELLRRFTIYWIVEHAPSLTLAHVLRLYCLRGVHGSWWDMLDYRADPGADPRALSDLIARAA